MRLIETDTLSNQNISSALLIGAYTADAARMVFARVFVDQVAGNGDYTAYTTIQLGGAGSAYRVLPITTAAAAAGVTAIAFTTIAIPVAATDVVRIYVTGLVGDTTTPDTRVEFWEDDSLLPTVTGRTLDVAATGEAGLDFDNVKTATAPTTLTNVTVPAVADVTNGVTLANDAITSAKFDESTAFPLKSADTGATQVARVGADGDTLETLSDQLDAQEPADVWAYATRTLTQSAASVAAAVSGSAITIQRGDTLSAALTGLGSLAGRTKLWFTVKASVGDADAAAIIQIEETAGLVYLNAATGTAGNGDVTVDSEAAGNITITMAAAASAALTPASGLIYDVQMLTASGVTTLATGSLTVNADVTRAAA